MTAEGWLPEGKRAAICFSIDDVHPSTSADAYEAGGDLEKGVLGRLRWLLDRHPLLQVTLFMPADWREISPFVTRPLLARIPYLRDRLFLTPVLPKGTMRLDRHPGFVRFLREMPRTQLGLHGLYHVHPGPRLNTEFQDESRAQCRRALSGAIEIFRRAGIDYSPGMCPPAWEASPNLLAAMADVGLEFVASARDVLSPVSRDGRTDMSGKKGMSLLYPEVIQNGRLVHITSNFAANNPIDRAFEIVELGGLMAIKGHAIKQALGYTAIDGIDDLYCNYIDLVLTRLEERYGDSLWWPSLHEVATRVLAAHRASPETRNPDEATPAARAEKPSA